MSGNRIEQDVTLNTFALRQGDTTLEVSPREHTFTSGTELAVTVSWSQLQPGTPHLGGVMVIDDDGTGKGILLEIQA